MNLSKRLAVLEKGFTTEPTILTMPNGSCVSLALRGDRLAQLAGAVFGEVTPSLAADLDLIRQSVAIREPGGARMLELIRAVLLSPVNGDA